MKIIVILALALSIFVSCGEMNDLHQKYLDAGEVVYIGLPDSVEVSNGYERIQLEWQVNADPKVSSCIIYWNERKDSLTLPIESSKPAVIIPLEQGNYNFELIHKADDGTASLTTTTFGISYGADYQATLSARPLDVSPFEDSTVINWGNTEGCIGVNLTYETKEGGSNTISAGADVAQTVLYDSPLGGEFTYESLYLPEEGALDTIPSDPTTMNFPSYVLLSKNTWEIDSVSSQDGWSVASKIIDDDLGSGWHSKWAGGKIPFPHIIIIDMQENKTVSSLELLRQKGNTDTKDVDFELSIDNETWTSIGGVSYPNSNSDANTPFSRILKLSTPTMGRYLKVIVKSTNKADQNNPDTSLTEIYVTGAN